MWSFAQRRKCAVVAASFSHSSWRARCGRGACASRATRAERPSGRTAPRWSAGGLAHVAGDVAAEVREAGEAEVDAHRDHGRQAIALGEVGLLIAGPDHLHVRLRAEPRGAAKKSVDAVGRLGVGEQLVLELRPVDRVAVVDASSSSPDASTASVGGHSAKSAIQPSAPMRDARRRITPFAHATAVGIRQVEQLRVAERDAGERVRLAASRS